MKKGMQEQLADLPKGTTVYVVVRKDTPKYRYMDVFAILKDDEHPISYPVGDLWFWNHIDGVPYKYGEGFKIQKGGVKPQYDLVERLGLSLHNDALWFITREV